MLHRPTTGVISQFGDGRAHLNGVAKPHLSPVDRFFTKQHRSDVGNPVETKLNAIAIEDVDPGIGTVGQVDGVAHVLVWVDFVPADFEGFGVHESSLEHPHCRFEKQTHHSTPTGGNGWINEPRHIHLDRPSMTAMTTDTSAEHTAAELNPIPAAEPDPLDSVLPKPISFEARYGDGIGRSLVLGGGGVYFVAWQVAYLNELIRRGVQLEEAERIVGTSAGSLVSSILASRGLKRFGKQVDWIAKVPALVNLLAPASHFHESQVRALEMFRDADNSDPATIKAIGHAALSANTPTAAEMRRSTGFAIAARGWPSPALHITAVDAYTGERLVVTQEAQTSAIRAAAASSAVPGIFSPQRLHDRWCMDGGVSGSGTHCDLVAGSKKAFVISLGAVVESDFGTMTLSPSSFKDEMDELAKAGTVAIARGPKKVDLSRLMDPDAVPEAIALGVEQAGEDVEELTAFWNS